ncbi:SRPBCC family protein [uncultured Friedmanniella sp.]|uniref:SRPBCC family protein n=1 Tax=uncultured Friedmanniella sp. TaxID=335381 RepID=UPI0035CB1611
MSTRLEVAATTEADLDRSWEVLVDWAGQSRWIPLTTVDVAQGDGRGVGSRLVALSGFWLGRVPVGLLDRFVVTGWSPPREGEAELEVLHLGPYFTGEGVFHLHDLGDRTEVRATEVFTVPGGPPTNVPARWLLPLMRVAFGSSLRQFAAVAEGRGRS